MYTECPILNDADFSKTVVDTEKCFKQKLYSSKRDIRRYHWFDLK